MLAGNFKPDRELFAIIWHHMLVAKEASDAHQCFEALKLLQASFPCVPNDEKLSGWCPRTLDDYNLLVECLRRTAPQEENADKRNKRNEYPEWVIVSTTHSERCLLAKGGRATTWETLKDAAPPCRKALECERREEPSPYFSLLLRFLVQLLTEDARALGPSEYAKSAAMAMFMPREADRWALVASILIEGIGSQLLSRDVSDSYFALLHLLVDVCGHASNNEREKYVEIWFTTAGLPLLEAASQDVNDSLAELLQRSQWHSMKLTWVSFVLMTRFDAKEISSKSKKYLEDPQNKSKIGERLVFVFFWLKAKGGEARKDEGPVELEDRSFDNESLVIFVASAWQSARVLAASNPSLLEYLNSHRAEIRLGFEFFDARIKRLSVLRGKRSSSQSQSTEKTSERVVMYMTLLRAIISGFIDEAQEPTSKKVKQ
jgi:hypothetical protein